MMDRVKAAIAATLLDRVARGELDPAVALREWPQSDERDALLESAWHDLSHFATDADVRAKDSRYAAYQISVLQKRAQQIRDQHSVS